MKETDSIMTIYQSNKKNIGSLQDANERLAVHNRKIKYRLEHVIAQLVANNNSGGVDNMEGSASAAAGAVGTSKKLKQKCEYCGKAYVNLDNHYLKCEKKKLLDGI